MLVQIVTENGQKKIKPLTADAGSGVALGMIVPFFVKRERSGYLFCDGSRFDTTKYPLLYAELGTDILPDCREVGLKGAEKNTTYIFDSTETDPRTGQAGTQNHDVFAQGEFKDDQLQAHGHDSITDNTQISAMGSGSTGWETKTYNINFSSRSSHTTNTKDCRKGDVTRGKSLAVYWYIKATSGLTEGQQDDVANIINGERSYSTSEIDTGMLWTNGKHIYKKTFSKPITDFPVSTGITNIDEVIKIETTGKDVTNYFSLPFYTNSAGHEYYAGATFNPTSGVFNIETNLNLVNVKSTILYTKTTD